MGIQKSGTTDSSYAKNPDRVDLRISEQCERILKAPGCAVLYNSQLAIYYMCVNYAVTYITTSRTVCLVCLGLC